MDYMVDMVDIDSRERDKGSNRERGDDHLECSPDSLAWEGQGSFSQVECLILSAEWNTHGASSEEQSQVRSASLS